MSYGVRAFPIDCYDRKKEHLKTFKRSEDMWRWVFEYLTPGQRKVIVYRETKMPRWHNLRRTRVQKIAELTKPEEVPGDFIESRNGDF